MAQQRELGGSRGAECQEGQVAYTGIARADGRRVAVRRMRRAQLPHPQEVPQVLAEAETCTLSLQERHRGQPHSRKRRRRKRSRSGRSNRQGASADRMAATKPCAQDAKGSDGPRAGRGRCGARPRGRSEGHHEGADCAAPGTDRQYRAGGVRGGSLPPQGPGARSGEAAPGGDREHQGHPPHRDEGQSREKRARRRRITRRKGR